MNPMLNIAIQAARSASKIIMRFVDHLDTVGINEKGRNDIVTEVDHLAEQEIINHIRKAYPNHSILAEETGYQEGDDFCWIIDPLDGTANYVHGFPHYAISIALKRHNQLLLGVIYDPIRNELFSAVRGDGAYLDNRRIRVSQCKKLEYALIGTGFPFRDIHHFKPYLRMFESLFPKTSGIRRAGAASLGLAYVAAGRLEGYWESSIKEWDMAAGIMLIQEAGGLVSDFQGEDQYFDSGNIIAGNPRIFKAISEVLRKSIQEQ